MTTFLGSPPQGPTTLSVSHPLALALVELHQQTEGCQEGLPSLEANWQRRPGHVGLLNSFSFPNKVAASKLSLARANSRAAPRNRLGEPQVVPGISLINHMMAIPRACARRLPLPHLPARAQLGSPPGQ